MNAFSERVPPQNLEAEQSVLGAMLIDREAVVAVAHKLVPEDFYADRHQHLFAAMLALYNRGEPVDPITVQDELIRTGQLEEVGGLTYLTSLINLVPTTANVLQYAEIVESKAILRRLQTAARRIVDECYTAEDVETDAAGGGEVDLRRDPAPVRPGVPAHPRRPGHRVRPPGAPLLHQGPDHRRTVRLPGPGRDDVGLSALGPDHRRRTPVGGQDRLHPRTSRATPRCRPKRR